MCFKDATAVQTKQSVSIAYCQDIARQAEITCGVNDVIKVNYLPSGLTPLINIISLTNWTRTLNNAHHNYVNATNGLIILLLWDIYRA